MWLSLILHFAWNALQVNVRYLNITRMGYMPQFNDFQVTWNMKIGRATSELQSHSDLVCRLLLDPAPTDIYTLSLHDALPISPISFFALPAIDDEVLLIWLSYVVEFDITFCVECSSG